MPTDHIGHLIARARHRKRMTQAQLAEALGVTQVTVARWETGEHYPVRNAGAIEDLLDITIPAAGEDIPA